MDSDIPDPKNVHKLAFNELKLHLLSEEKIPINLYVENGIKNYLFVLKKCDLEGQIFQYEYNSLITG